MEKTLAAPKNLLQTLAGNLKFIIPSLLVFFSLLGFNIWRLYTSATPEYLDNGIPVHPEIEERFGIRFTSLSVVGKGGLLDLRYRVVDAGKAKNFGHYAETSPMLIAADGRQVEVTIMMLHNHRVEGGRVYYILFRNTDNAIKPGEKVTIQLDDILLEQVIAQ
jgi:hypothetical protein